MGWWQSEVAQWTQAGLAGAAGGIVRWIALKEGWRDGAGSIICGSLMAVFAGPALQPMWTLGGVIERAGLSSVQALMFSGFCTGVCGILITGFIIDVFKARTGQVRRGKKEADQ